MPSRARGEFVSLYSCLKTNLSKRGVRLEVRANVRGEVFTVAILAQGTNRGDALCAALLCNRAVSILADVVFLVLLAKRARVRDGVRPAKSLP